MSPGYICLINNLSIFVHLKIRIMFSELLIRSNQHFFNISRIIILCDLLAAVRLRMPSVFARWNFEATNFNPSLKGPSDLKVFMGPG